MDSPYKCNVYKYGTTEFFTLIEDNAFAGAWIEDPQFKVFTKHINVGIKVGDKLTTTIDKLQNSDYFNDWRIIASGNYLSISSNDTRISCRIENGKIKDISYTFWDIDI